MKWDRMLETDVMDDAKLVERCLNGDREAFGQIVARYQTVICALAFSACGDMGRSEDLAQEIFIRAWQNLCKLKEPNRLRGWLCGIARNVINASFRDEVHDPVALSESLDETVAADWTEPAGPPEQAMSKEESALLWRVLEGLPRAYREPMVLFYRQNESMSEVAEALEISEEAVRQRLSRGRALLNERLERLVESGLRRAAPSKNFGLAVMAALPIVGTQASATGVATSMAAASGGAKAAGVLGTILTVATTVLAPLAALVALWGRIQCTRSARERRFAVLSTLGLMVWPMVVVFFALGVLRHGSLQISKLADALGLSLVWLVFCGPLDAYAIWMARRQRQIRIEQGTAIEQESFSLGLPAPGASRTGLKLAVFGSIAALVCGTTGWLLLMAFKAGDWLALGIQTLLSIGGWLVASSLAVQHASQLRRVYIWVLWGLLFCILGMMNLRWEAWTGGALYAWPTELAPIGLNLLAVVLFGSIRAGWFLKEHIVQARDVRDWIAGSLVVYGFILLLGFGAFKWAKAHEPVLPIATQSTINEILPDGTIRFRAISETPNQSMFALETFRFVNSDFVHLEKITDRDGKPLAFTTIHERDYYRYTVPLNPPVRPGAPICIGMEGYVSNQVARLGPLQAATGEFKYHEQHWPANGLETRRIEVYQLPAGAEVLQTIPPNIPTKLLPDGRTELRVEQVISPGRSIEVEIRYRLKKLAMSK